MSEPYSIDDFADGKFKPHGRLEMTREGNLTISHAEGPFNLEAVKALDKARLAALANWEFVGRRATIIVFHSNMLMSPDALDAYAQGLLAHVATVNLPVAVAWVAAPNVDGRAIMMPHFAKIFAQIDAPWREFEDLNEAKAWVKSLMDAEAAGQA